MIEMSATTVPALARPGAILAAAPAPASSEGGQSTDFSAVLAGAALVAPMPEPAVAPEPEPQTPAPIVPELVAASAKPAGKSGPSGKETGKMLPTGKLPVERDIAVSTKASHAALSDEIEDEPAKPQEAVPAEQVTVDAPVQSAPTPPTPIVIQQTANALQERGISHDATQTTVEPAPAWPASAVSRQTVTPHPVAKAIPTLKQTAASASPSHAAEIVADMPLTNTPMTMASDTVAASSHVMPVAASRGIPADWSSETSAEQPRNAVPSNAAPAPSKAVAADGFGTATNASANPQTAAVASTPSATVNASIAVPAPLVSTKAALVATTAANLMQPDIAQTSPLPVRTDGSNASVVATDVADIALARAVAPAPATTTPMPPPMAPVETYIALQPTTLTTAPTSFVVPSMATSNLQAASSAIIAPVLSAKAETVGSQASDHLTIAAPVPSHSTLDQGKSAIQLKPTVTAPVAQSTRDAAVSAASLPAQPLHQAFTTPLPATSTAAPLATALPMAAPEVAIQQAATIAPAPSQPRTEPVIAAQPALAAAEPGEHKRALPVAATELPATMSRPAATPIVTGNDMRTAAIFAAPTTPAPATTPTQDIAALVDRITEARAAAAPNTIRAALVHEDFGSVSLNFRSEASHIHVTLGSADPGFAPAVQAAAAANLANNGSDDAQNRRDAPAPQTNPQPQDASRNDASSQQQQAQRDRANAGERQPSRQTPGRSAAQFGEHASTATVPERRTGIYA